MIASIPRKTRPRIAAAITIALALLFGTSAAAAAASEPIYVEVAVPAPGHATTWEMPFANDAATDVEVWLFTRQGNGDALPLLFELLDGNGRTVLGPVPLAELHGASRSLGHVAATTSVVFTGRVWMPREVGNEVQGRSQSFSVLLSSMDAGNGAPATTNEGALATTGLDIAWIALAAATVALILGFLLLGGRRKNSDDDKRASPLEAENHS